MIRWRAPFGTGLRASCLPEGSLLHPYELAITICTQNVRSLPVVIPTEHLLGRCFDALDNDREMGDQGRNRPDGGPQR